MSSPGPTTAVAAPPRGGLPPGPALPMAAQTALWMLRPLPFLESCRSRFGDVFTMRLPLGDVVHVCHPEGVRALFGADPGAARAGEANRVLEPLVGRRSVLLLDGSEHLRQRRLMLPAFHGERIQGFGRIIEEVTERELEGWRWRAGATLALRPAMQRITLEVILRAVFGANQGDELVELRTRITAVLDSGSTLAMLPWFRHELGGRTPWGRFLRLRDEADEAVYRLIRRRRATAAAAPEAARQDILAALLAARDEAGAALSDAELRDELVTLLLAGHETTATALAWFFDLVLRHPAVERRLDAELAAGSLDYLDAVIRETLRLRPTVPAVARVLHDELEVMGHRLPTGTVVAANILGVHFNERVHAEPQAFRPERFAGTRPDVFSWLPFGGGVRRCLGASFATAEMRTVIPAVLRRVRLRHASGRAEPVTRRAVTLAPRHGTRVVVLERRG